MSKKSKGRIEAEAKVDRTRAYRLAEALEISKGAARAKFDETIEMALRLGVDPTKADQMVRGSVILPRGSGKERKILVFAKGEKILEARSAGADFVGGDDLIEKIKGGWFGFDVAIATPDMMGSVGKIGKFLGPRGLMPNPKSGSVTFDVEAAIKEFRAGKVEFRIDKGAVVHAPIGKASFPVDWLVENAEALIETTRKLKPASSKGAYIRAISVSSTMGPGVKVDSSTQAAASAAK